MLLENVELQSRVKNNTILSDKYIHCSLPKIGILNISAAMHRKRVNMWIC